MSTTTEWDLGPDPILHNTRKQPYQDAAPTAPPEPEATVETAPIPQPIPQRPARKARRRVNPLAQWLGDMRGDVAARKARADGRWWLMRWMGEQPTSVADYVDYILHHREERPGGRRGWGLRTEAMLIDGAHAFFYVIYGLFVGLPLTMLAYALGWMAQRPGRAALFVALLIFVINNLSTWLSGS